MMMTAGLERKIKEEYGRDTGWQGEARPGAVIERNELKKGKLRTGDHGARVGEEYGEGEQIDSGQ